MIFELAWHTQDSGISYHFQVPEGHTHADFRFLCDRLMQEAAKDATENKYKSVLHCGGGPRWIGYDMLVEEVAARLPDHGYQRVQFPCMPYEHGMIIKSPEEDHHNVLGEVLPAVIEYNKDMERRMK